jgi:hypothetical protein
MEEAAKQIAGCRSGRRLSVRACRVCWRRAGVSGTIVYGRSWLRKPASIEVCSSSSERRSGHDLCETEHDDRRSRVENLRHDESPYLSLLPYLDLN